MRGFEDEQPNFYSYVSMEARIPMDHPLRAVRRLLDQALRRMGPLFARIYSKQGRPSIAPEQLIRALVLQRLYSIPSERKLIEQIDFNILFRWFVGMSMDEPIWHATTITKIRERALSEGILDEFFGLVTEVAAGCGLLSKEHFSVDGTLIDACASMKSFRPKDESEKRSGKKKGGGGAADGGKNSGVDFRGEKRSNETHASTTDPNARLFRKSNGTTSRLCYGGHIVTENRNGLIVEAMVTRAGTKAERDAALAMMDRRPRKLRRTLGADRGYDVEAFHQALRARNITPHIAMRKDSRLDERTTRHRGYLISQRKRKRVEEPFGWMKTVGCLRGFLHRGKERVGAVFLMTAAAYNLLRMAKLTNPI